MKIRVTVKPNAGRTKVDRTGEGEYRVSVAAPPAEGKANAAVVAALAEFFSVPKSLVRISRGASGRRKIVEIDLCE